MQNGSSGKFRKRKGGGGKSNSLRPLPAGECFLFRRESAFASAFESTLRVIQQLSDLDGIFETSPVEFSLNVMPPPWIFFQTWN